MCEIRQQLVQFRIPHLVFRTGLCEIVIHHVKGHNRETQREWSVLTCVMEEIRRWSTAVLSSCVASF